MKKSTLYLFLFVFVISSLYLGLRLYVQSQEFEKSRTIIERQTEELDMLLELLNISDLKLNEVRKYLNERYPEEDLGPYSQQIQWRGMDFYFPRDSTVFAISYTAKDWACGTVFGCVSSTPNYLISYTDSFLGRVVVFIAHYLAYPTMIVLFVIAFWQLYKSRNLKSSDFKIISLIWAIGLLVFTFFIAFGFATAWWDLVLNTGASRELLLAGWSELWFRVGLGLIFSFFLTLMGFYGQRFIVFPKNDATAL
ncbi:hypothetical protein [Rhodohalobacter sp. 8-1]|uniref:hypothetical protein n=1 Tax=Rhodohalobacter sp. 8-1 TaxID=3131972 RepID=UPI0030EC51BA